MPLTLSVVNLQPYKVAQPCPSRCMLSTYSPTRLPNHVCSPCRLPTYSHTRLPNHVCSPCRLPTYSPTRLPNHACSPCRLPTYSPTRLPNHAPHRVGRQPTALQVRPTMPLTLSVVNLQPYKVAQPCPSRCMLSTYSLTRLPNHVCSPCRLPTYSLTSSSNHAPHAVCCQPTVLQGCPTMPLTL